MARDSYTATVSSATGLPTVGRSAEASAQIAAAQGADLTAVDNAVADLVADGASPTEGHVTTLNTAWTALKADIQAIYAMNADVVLNFNGTNVVNKNNLRAAVAAIVKQATNNASILSGS